MATKMSHPLLAGCTISFILRTSFTLKNGEHPIALKIVNYQHLWPVKQPI
jgi:hypothetical protein